MSVIVRLEAENIKRIRSVAIRPNGSVVTVAGRNAQGKTSCLDAIQYALAGGRSLPPRVIRDGETEAHVILELDDLVVERRWTGNDKSYLEVRDKDGLKHRSPQALLDKLVGELSFDPLAFTRLPPKLQAEALRKLSGVDFTALERKRELLYQQRTDANRDVARLQAKVAGADKGEPGEEVSVAELVARANEAHAGKAKNDRIREEARRAMEAVPAASKAVSGAQERIRQLEVQLAQARQQLETASQAETAAMERAEKAEAYVQQLVDPDPTTFTAQLADAEKVNARRRAAKAFAQLTAELKAAEERVADLSGKIGAIDYEKEDLLEQAKLPVPGLSFTAEGVLLNGVPLEQASGAEQLRVSLAMGIAANPKLKVILIRDGSLLDDRSLELVARMAEEAGAQVWLERVADGEGGASVIIEDGTARGPAAEEAQVAHG